MWFRVCHTLVRSLAKALNCDKSRGLRPPPFGAAAMNESAHDVHARHSIRPGIRLSHRYRRLGRRKKKRALRAGKTCTMRGKDLFADNGESRSARQILHFCRGCLDRIIDQLVGPVLCGKQVATDERSIPSSSRPPTCFKRGKVSYAV